MLQLPHTEDHLSINENVKKQDSIKSLWTNYSTVFLRQWVTKDPTCSESSSTLTDLKTQKFPDLVRVIPPANRCRDYSSTLSYSSNIFQTENKNSAGKRNLDKSEHMVVDLTEDGFRDEKRGNRIIASCSSKKTKLVKTEDDLCQRNNFQKNQSAFGISSKCNPSLKQEISENSEITQNAVSSSTLCYDEEKRGSTFLSQHTQTLQVKEKLTDAEYKDFVGFMRALKSKAEKASHVLQSIARLFSAPDRLPLLQRFKDYAPAKYQHLYELYLVYLE